MNVTVDAAGKAVFAKTKDGLAGGTRQPRLRPSSPA